MASPLRFNVGEVEAILAELAIIERRWRREAGLPVNGTAPLSARMIRYWDRPGGVRPSQRDGQGRLYSVLDIALLRVVQQIMFLRKLYDFPARCVWGCLAFHGDALREVLAQPRIAERTYLAVDIAGVSKILRGPVDPASLSTRECGVLELRLVLAGLQQAAEGYRGESDVWTGLQWMDRASAGAA